MNEYKLYRDHVISWVFYLVHKYCHAPRFDAMREAFKAALVEEELDAARIMHREAQS